MTTERQKNAVAFCEEWLHIEFKGDINNFNDVSSFLSLHLDVAKAIAEDAVMAYYTHFDY